MSTKENGPYPYEYRKYVFTKVPNLLEAETIDILLSSNAPDEYQSKAAPSTDSIIHK